jgi:dipeptidyl-peptidase-4
LDPAKKYPLILFVYGGPASQTVTQEWGSARRARYSLFHRALTGLGFIVVSVDPRGTPSLKGTEWRQQIYGSIGPLASKDFAAAVRRLEAEHPYIDAGRIGVWGLKNLPHDVRKRV